MSGQYGMKINAERPIANCFNGDFMREIELDVGICVNFIHYLATLGETRLDYYEDFPRPFFKLDRPGYYILKGIKDARLLKVYYSRASVTRAREALHAHILAFN